MINKKINVKVDGIDTELQENQIPTDNEGRPLTVLLSTDVKDVYVIDEEHYNKETLIKAKKDLVATVEKYIQKEVDKYNELNNMLFKDVHNCATYKDIDTYPHQQFCIGIVAFNALVWESARTIESEVLQGKRAMPTPEELVLELPTYTGGTS